MAGRFSTVAAVVTEIFQQRFRLCIAIAFIPWVLTEDATLINPAMEVLTEVLFNRSVRSDVLTNSPDPSNFFTEWQTY